MSFVVLISNDYAFYDVSYVVVSIIVLYQQLGHVALDRNPGPGITPLLFFDKSQEVFIVHVTIDSSTHYPAFVPVGLHCQTQSLSCRVLGRYVVCTIFVMVFGMTRSEPIRSRTELQSTA